MEKSKKGKRTSKSAPLLVKGELKPVQSPEFKEIAPKALASLTEEEAIEKNRLDEEKA